jgi:DNA-binding LacI/PurR family transcriptional regulator
MIRLKDIALRAGVSVMTASKALRDAHDVAATTKARVKMVAQQLGYVPDFSAQSLRTRSTKLLGVVIPTIGDPAFTRVVLAIGDRAQELGYEIILAQTMNTEEREASSIQKLLSRRVDGLFIAPVYRHKIESPIFQSLPSRNIPVVILGPHAPFTRAFPNVETEDMLASYAITRHLLDLGHRRIAFFGGPNFAPWCSERLEGYRRALRSANIDVDDRMIFEAGFTIEDGAKAALQYINETAPENRATAVQAVNDMVAIGAANTFLSQKLEIPGDISVAGFGNTLTSEHFRVPLTTARQPKHRLGIAAMDIMQKLLRHERAESKRIRAELAIRQSTARPKSTNAQ